MSADVLRLLDRGVVFMDCDRLDREILVSVAAGGGRKCRATVSFGDSQEAGGHSYLNRGKLL